MSMVMTIEQRGFFGEQLKGILLRPEQVSILGAIDGENGYVIAVSVKSDGCEDPLVLMLPLEFGEPFIRLLREKIDELRTSMTAPRS